MRVIAAEYLTGFSSQPSEYLDEADLELELSDDPTSLNKFWGVVLLMSLQYRGSSIHYHPWRADDGLAILVGNERYVLNPAPASLAKEIVAAARSLVLPTGRVARWFASRRATVTGSFTFDVWGQRVEWDLVCWSVVKRYGVEFYRVAPPVNADSTEPVASADGGA